MTKNLILFVFIANSFLPHAHAITKKVLFAQDPQARSIVATDEFSPYPTMLMASYFGALSSVFYFAPSIESPDYNRTQVKDANAVAAGVVLAGGLVNMLFGVAASPLMSSKEREKLGALSADEMNSEVIGTQKKFFLMSHLINTVAIGAVASQSLREDRWTVVAVQAILPYVADLSARHIFGSRAVSPWSVAVFPTYEGDSANVVLALGRSW